MVRNQFQDIKKIKKNNEYKFIKKTYIPSDASEILKANVNNPNFYNKEKSKPRYTLWFVALVSVVFLFFALSFLFSSANVTINPKIKSISLNQDIVAIKDSNSDSEELSFASITLSDQDSKLISAGEEKDYKEKAKGKVVIYNKFSSSSQPLLVDTRLEGSNGKIYKTKTKVTVPGIKKDGNPGMVSVDIYATEDGADYNTPPIDLKILGFKGTSKYSKFEVRSVGEISGGIVGISRRVSEDQKINTANEVKINLENKLYSKAINQIPEGFILFKEASSLSIDDESFTSSEDGSVTFTIKGTLNGFLFNKDKLTKQIINFLIPDYDGSNVYISNLEDLTFTITNKENILFSDIKSVNFNLYGVPRIIYKIDLIKLTSDLLSKNKKEFNQILLKYPNIESAELSIKPIWKSTFPEKIERIKIIINYP